MPQRCNSDLRSPFVFLSMLLRLGSCLACVAGVSFRVILWSRMKPSVVCLRREGHGKPRGRHRGRVERPL